MLDLIKQKSLDLSEIQTVVLDEADEMLSMGFIEDIEAILAATPDVRQTALLSATLPTRIRHLARKYMHQPEMVLIKKKQLTVAAIEQRYYVVNEKDKLAALTRLFEMEEITCALIFAKTRVGTGVLANALTTRGFPAEPLNGDLSQDARERVLGRFRKGQITVLVATDVAARGLDIDDISHVFNYDLPADPEVFVHRIGRTGRAGRTGIAISLASPKERGRIRRIEGYAKQKLTLGTLPTIEEIRQHREDALMKKLEVWLRRGRCRRERELLETLVEAGHDPLELAAVALKIARAEEKQRPISEISPVSERSSYKDRNDRRGNRRHGRNRNERGGRSNRSERNGERRPNRSRSNREPEAGMICLTLDMGRSDGVRPNDVVGTIAFHADIPGRSIGRITIQDQRTLVDVPERFAAKVLSKTGVCQIHKKNVAISRLN